MLPRNSKVGGHMGLFLKIAGTLLRFFVSKIEGLNVRGIVSDTCPCAG